MIVYTYTYPLFEVSIDLENSYISWVILPKIFGLATKDLEP